MNSHKIPRGITPLIILPLLIALSLPVSAVHCECDCYNDTLQADGATQESCYRQCGIACGSLTWVSADCVVSCNSATGYCNPTDVTATALGGRVREGCRGSCEKTCEILAMEGTATDTLRTIALVVAAVVLAICGLKFLLSEDPSSRDEGKKCVMYVIVALIVVGISFHLVELFYGPEVEIPAFGAIIFYKDDNFAGDQLMYSTPGEISDLGPTGIEDEISSIKIERGFYAIIYEDDNFGGDKRTVKDSISDLDPMDWNDRISSVKIIAGEGPTGVFLYEDKNFGEDELLYEAPQEVSDLHSIGWGDRISSIRIDGDLYVILYWDKNFEGDSREIRANVTDLGSIGWNDKISSIKIMR